MPLPQYCFSTLRGPGCSVPPLSSLPCCHHFPVHHHDCSLTEVLSTWPIVFLHTLIFAFKLVGWYLHGWPIQHHGPSISLFSFPVKLLQRVVSYCLYFPYSFLSPPLSHSKKDADPACHPNNSNDLHRTCPHSSN